MTSDLKLIIRDNVRRLLGLEVGTSGVQLLINIGVSNGSATRFFQGETNFGVKTLAELAKGLQIEPWQLCVPGITRESLPTLHKPPKLSPSVLQLAAAMEKMDDEGRDILLKMADALIRPQPPASPLAESSMLPTGSPARVQ